MQSYEQSNNAIPEVSLRSITELFSRFAIVYKSKWAVNDDRIRKQQMAEWQKVMNDLPDTVIRKAADRWIEKNIWPPASPGEFKIFSLEVKKDMQRENEIETAKRSLPPPPTDVEVCFAKTLQAIKRIKHDNPELSWPEVGRIYEEQKRHANAERPV